MSTKIENYLTKHEEYFLGGLEGAFLNDELEDGAWLANLEDAAYILMQPLECPNQFLKPNDVVHHYLPILTRKMEEEINSHENE